MRNLRRLIIGHLFLLITNPVVAQSITGLSGWNIYLDPGHSQTANMGIYGYSEAEKNLGVALNLYQLLMDSTDIDTVFMSRTDSIEYVGLSERCIDANNLGAAWYHSIHSDAGAPESNSTLLLWGELNNGNPDPPVGGEDMSNIMVDLLTRGMQTSTRGSIGDCSFYTWSDWCEESGGPYLAVNRLTTMPSELSEAGFHTNPQQNQLNMNADWKRMEAWTFFWSILKFHEIVRPTVSILNGVVENTETGTPINGATVNINNQSYTADTFESLFHHYTNDPEFLRNGYYYFEGLPNDSLVEIIVMADGYYSDTTSVVLADTFFTYLDLPLLSSASPQVVGTEPTENDSAFPAWDPIIIDFSRSMDTSSVQQSFELEPNTTGSFAWSNDNKKFYYYADSMEFLADYSLTISDSGRDQYGHCLDGNADGNPGGDFVLTFRTGPSDIFPPTIENVIPPLVANNIELTPIINIMFDEIVADTPPVSDFIRLERFSTHTDVAVQIVHYRVNNKSTVNIFPENPLFPNEFYVTRLSPGIADLSGNVTTANRAYNFSTGNYDFSITTIDDFEGDILTNWAEPQHSNSTTGILSDSTYHRANTDWINVGTESQQALEIHYGWDENAGDWLLRESLVNGSPSTVIFTDSTILQAVVFGDGSGNRFRLVLDDNYPDSAAVNHEVSPWYIVDWIGWKLISWDLSVDGTGDWVGDGSLEGLLRFDSIQLTKTDTGSQFGQIIFDDLRIVTRTTLSNQSDIASIPSGFYLSQNFPNPFNPKTQIRYQLPLHGKISLKIFDIQGRLATILVDQFQPAGEYTVTWDGRDLNGKMLSSGVYIYTLETAEEIQSRRMVFLK